MASISANGSNGHHKFTLNVNETTVSGSADNYSIVTFSLVLSAVQNGYDWNYSSTVPVTYTIKINGTTYTGNIMSYNGSSTVTIKSGTQNIPHNDDGTKTITYSFSISSISGSYLPGSASASGNLALTTIPRYTSITSFSISKRNETSVTFNWGTADTIDYVWYSTDNGSSWTGYNVADGTSGNFNVGSLSANTTYKCKLRVRRKDSQLTTDSSTVSQTTYSSPTQSLSSKTETRITISWSCDDTVDYVSYSIDGGTTFVDFGSVNAKTGSYTITGLTANTTYKIKTRLRRKTTQLSSNTSSLSVATYKVPTQSLKSKTETSITMNWSCDSTVSKVEYSTNGGTSWSTATSNANATSGSYTISGLSANTSYSIKTRLTRSTTSTNYSTTATSVTTYQYPYVSAVGTGTLTIGNSQTLTLYNPLGRSCTVYMKQTNTSGTTLYSKSGVTGTSLTFTPTASNLYASIPSATSGNAIYYCIYSNQTVSTKSGTYKIKGTETPTFSNFTYKDSNTTVTNVTGNNQIMVKGLSTVQVTISSANKMVAQNSSTGKNYSINMSDLNASVNYSTSDIVKELGTINESGTKSLSVIAYDSRGLKQSVYKDVTVYNYSKPVINTIIERLNNFENETTIKVNGTYTRLTINNTDKNTITTVRYRYRQTGGSWSSWNTFTTTVTAGRFTCTDVLLSLDNTKSFEFQIQATDTLSQSTTNTVNLDKGQAIFFISTNNETCYINGYEVLTENGGTLINKLIYSSDGLYSPHASGIYFNQYGNIVTKQVLSSGNWSINNDGNSVLKLNWSNNRLDLLGNIQMNSLTAGESKGVWLYNNLHNISFQSNTSGYAGLYDNQNSKWLINSSTAGVVTVDGGTISINGDTITSKAIVGNHFLEAKPSTATTLTTTASKIALGTIQNENDSAGILSLSGGGILCGRAGTVMVSACAYFSGLTAEDNVTIYIYKNSSSETQTLLKQNRTTYYVNITPRYINVSAGDIIYLYGVNGSGARGTSSTNINTRLTVEYVK